MYSSNHGFFEQVYQIVSNIPEGSVMTYGMIAAMIGRPRAARIVGYAMHDAPEDRRLPCHRVVNKEGKLSPEGIFGEGIQRKLLEQEGITFKENGCIDMDKHLVHWNF
ncbi:MAG: O-6-methylguanine methyltransferase [Herbinix sp.]|jgi:methylated-DNA-protein-cysteine methyltransferase-like protein|nr:O-6-methylguanine methyltransferase [Herbinix sp.]